MGTTESPRNNPESAAALLSAAEQASTQMVRRSEYPRGLFALLLVLFSFGMSAKGIMPLWVLLIPVAIMIPLLVWFGLHTRKRAHMRPYTNRSSGGGWYFFTFILLAALLSIWEVSSWPMFAVKFLFTLIAAGFLMKRMHRELTAERVKDGNEQAC